MFLTLGMIAISLGTIAALTAAWFPVRQTQLERWGGDLMVAGVALLGFSFPMI